MVVSQAFSEDTDTSEVQYTVAQVCAQPYFVDEIIEILAAVVSKGYVICVDF